MHSYACQSACPCAHLPACSPAPKYPGGATRQNSSRSRTPTCTQRGGPNTPSDCVMEEPTGNVASQPNQPPHSSPYLERQEARYCQVHAYNALLGHRAIHPVKVLQLAEQTHNHIVQVTGRPVGIRGLQYCGGNSPGNFTTEMLNYYISTTHAPHKFITPLNILPCRPQDKYPRGIRAGSTKDQIMQGLQDHKGAILYFTTPNGYEHAACLKEHNQRWYLLDSENPLPINLDDPPPPPQGVGRCTGTHLCIG